MKLSNHQQRNLPNGKSIFSLFRYAIVAVLIFSFILITSDRSYAEDPSAAIIRPFGSKIVVREGTNRNVTPWDRDKNGNLLGKLRGFKDTLEIPGDNKSKANLSFISENTVLVEYARLIISTVPSSDNTEYRFPCGLARGRITIGWRQAGKSADRACSEGISVGPGVGKLSYRPNLNYRDGLQASKKILLAQSFSDVIVVPPDSGSRFLQAVANENGAEIITLQGDILVKSGKHPQGRLIPEGNQYSYPQDTITPIDKNSIINSPAVQDFLNPNNWLSPDISQRVADGITGQLGEMRTALGQGSPAVASNSGNNNPRQSAIPTPSNNGVNLNGEWTFDFGFFSVKSDGSCEAAPEAGAYQGKITITQNGSQLNISPSGPVPMTNGNVSGNQFESRGQTPMRWVGTISSDGKKISGSGICGSVNMPFTMTRQGSQSVASNSSQQPSDLSGTWIARGTGFTGNNKGCFAGYSGRLTVDGQDAAPGNEFTMTQEGNQLRFPTQNVSYSNSTGSGSYTQSSNGTVSGNQVTTTTSGGGFTLRSTGTISNDGNTVTGQSICQHSGGSATANGSFTWTRKK